MRTNYINQTFAASLDAQFGAIEVAGYEFSASRVLRALAPSAYNRMQSDFVNDQLDDSSSEDAERIEDLEEHLG